MNTQSDQINELAKALSQAQSEIMGAVKDSKNPFFNSRYADLGAVWEAIRGPLTKNGLCVIQATDVVEAGGLVIVTTLAHSSGQWIRGFYPLNPIKNDPQGLGSALTYGRRYALAALVGVVQVDDDGEAAMGRHAPPQSQGVRPQQPEAGDGIKTNKVTISRGTYKALDPKTMPLADAQRHIELTEANVRKEGRRMTLEEAQEIEMINERLRFAEPEPFSFESAPTVVPKPAPRSRT